MSNTDNLTIAFLMVLSINVLMVIVGQGLLAEGFANPYNGADLTLNKFSNGNATNRDLPSDPTDLAPDTQSVGIDPDDNNVYTDIFTSSRSWLLDKTGVGFVLGVLSAPKVILSVSFPSLPNAVIWSITALWYGVTLLFAVAFMLGR